MSNAVVNRMQNSHHVWNAMDETFTPSSLLQIACLFVPLPTSYHYISLLPLTACYGMRGSGRTIEKACLTWVVGLNLTLSCHHSYVFQRIANKNERYEP